MTTARWWRVPASGRFPLSLQWSLLQRRGQPPLTPAQLPRIRARRAGRPRRRTQRSARGCGRTRLPSCRPPALCRTPVARHRRAASRPAPHSLPPLPPRRARSLPAPSRPACATTPTPCMCTTRQHVTHGQPARARGVARGWHATAGPRLSAALKVQYLPSSPGTVSMPTATGHDTQFHCAVQ